MKNRKTTAENLMGAQITYEGNRYQPVTHRAAIETLKGELSKRNFTLTSEEYLSASGGQRAIGKYGIRYNDELDYMIAFGNSMDGSLAFRISTGSIVRACSNGCLFGDAYNFKKKHFLGNTTIDLLSHITVAIEGIEETMKEHLQIKRRMQEIEVDKQIRASLIGDMFLNEGLIQSTQLSIIKSEIENPTHNYGNPDSLWSLFNYTTFAAKEQTPILWQKQHAGLGNYFIGKSGILVDSNSNPVEKIEIPEELQEVEYILDGGEVREV